MIASSANVPAIATPPINSGNSAATIEPNTRSSRRRVSGTATDSAITSDLPTWALISPYRPAGPPNRTVSPSWSPAYLSMSCPPRSTISP